MIAVKSHKRVRRNSVSIVRNHARAVTKKVAVKSSKVAAKPAFDWAKVMKYEEDMGDLVINFPGGAKYRYHNVPPSIEKRIAKDPKAALKYIKNTFTYSPDNAAATTTYKKAQKNRSKKK